MAWQWYKIGLSLNISNGFLYHLHQSNMSDIDKLSQVIQNWLDTCVSPTTWRALIAAIEGPIVYNLAKASEIQHYLSKEYVSY